MRINERIVMICPKCGNEIPGRLTECKNCGSDLTVYRKIYTLALRYYNKGLYAANAGNLSSAVTFLKKSLEIDKSCVDARNLLGLIYYRMGEIVVSIGEWVISKHYKEQNNIADYYLKKLQNNPNKLDVYSQAINKYNIALKSANEDSDDLAILQLKKVVSMVPTYISALNLLTLLFIKHGEKERAKKYIKRVLDIDSGNITAMYYKAAVEEKTEESAETEKEKSQESDSGINPLKSSNYREDRPNVMAWVNLIIGAAIGVAVTFILIVPTVTLKIKNQYDSDELNYASDLKVKEASVASLEDEVDIWKQKYEEVEKASDALKEAQVDTSIYDNYFSLLKLYMQTDASVAPSAEQLDSLAGKLASADISTIDNEDAKAAFEIMKSNIAAQTAEPSFEEGKTDFDNGDYENAAKLMQQAYDYGYLTDKSLYYLGKAYQMLGDSENAVKYYKEVVEKFPESKYVEYSQSRIDDLTSQ